MSPYTDIDKLKLVVSTAHILGDRQGDGRESILVRVKKLNFQCARDDLLVGNR
jgi:hypothetical protein